MTSITNHANAALDNMVEPIKLHSASKTAAERAKKAKAPAKKAKAPAKKAPAKKAPAAPKKAAKAAPEVQAILAKTDAAKKRLAARPKPEAKKAPAKKAKRAGSTYAQLAQSNTGASTIESPVQAMWNLCDAMQEHKRKEVIEAAVQKGISYYTARTQYQLWLTAFRNS